MSDAVDMQGLDTADDALEHAIHTIRAAVMAEVEHCVWASTGGRANGTPKERAQLDGAERVKDYLTRGGLDAAVAAALARLAGGAPTV